MRRNQWRAMKAVKYNGPCRQNSAVNVRRMLAAVRTSTAVEIGGLLQRVAVNCYKGGVVGQMSCNYIEVV